MRRWREDLWPEIWILLAMFALAGAFDYFIPRLAVGGVGPIHLTPLWWAGVGLIAVVIEATGAVTALARVQLGRPDVDEERAWAELRGLPRLAGLFTITVAAAEVVQLMWR
jgi:type VI protein secretion system component VasK